MAFDPNPASWITGWTTAATTTTAGSSVVIPIGSVPQLTATEAQATSSGDVRKCWFALVDKMYNSYNTIDVAGNAPTKMDVFKSASVNTSTNITTYTYTFTFQTQTLTEEVVAE
jgi:hypothetical protein